jgi:hypothetical protein
LDSAIKKDRWLLRQPKRDWTKPNRPPKTKLGNNFSKADGKSNFAKINEIS